MEKFICIKDFQYGDFAVGTVATIEEWREIAMSWADNDNNEELYKKLKKMPKKEIIDFIQEIWQIGIISINELDIKSMLEIIIDIDYISYSLDAIAKSNTGAIKKVTEEILNKTDKLIRNLYRKGE